MMSSLINAGLGINLALKKSGNSFSGSKGISFTFVFAADFTPLKFVTKSLSSYCYFSTKVEMDSFMLDELNYATSRF